MYSLEKAEQNYNSQIKYEIAQLEERKTFTAIFWAIIGAQFVVIIGLSIYICFSVRTYMDLTDKANSLKKKNQDITRA